MNRKLTNMFSISILMLMVSFSAFAFPPETFPYEGPDDIFVVDCGDYEVWTASWIKAKETYYFDKEGTPIRYHLSVQVFDAFYYNDQNPEIYIHNLGAGNGENVSLWADLVNGGFKESGMQFRIMLPGIGKLYMVAGRGSWDGENYTFSGLEVFPEGGTGSKLCEALAP